MYSPYFLHFSVNNPNFQLGIKLNMKHVHNYCTQRLSHMRNGTFNKSQIKTVKGLYILSTLNISKN